jgi:hypothetical protein
MPNPPDPLSNILYNVRINRGVSSDRKLLSTNGNGEVVDLYHQDDDSNRQKWRFTRLSDGSYNIAIYGGVSTNRRWLSTNGNGEVVDLWSRDDGSGRQRWVLEPLAIGCFRIRVKTGVSGDRKWLSCNGDGSRVDLWRADDSSGRQQWILVPEDVEIAKIDYNTTGGLISQPPDFISEVSVTNDSDVAQSTTVKFQKKAIESSSYEHQHGFSFSVSGTKNFGTPLAASGKITVTATTTHQWTYGQSQTREDTRTYEMPLVIPPRSRVVAKASVTLTQLDVPYTATGYSKLTGEAVTASGVWHGVSAGQIVYSIKQYPL